VTHEQEKLMAESEEKSEQKSNTSGETPSEPTATTPTEQPAETSTSGSTAKPAAASSTKAPAKASSKTEEKAGGKRRADSEKKAAPAGSTVNSIRSGVATAVWLLAVLAAVILALGALMIALDFNQKNGLVEFFTSTADNIDFGLFKEFKPGKGESADSVATKNALVNWGIAAVIYLVGGKILERIIRP
jgi:hypothetical protein